MMTRFQQEISGLLDEQVAKRTGEPNRHYWQRSAEKEVADIVKQYENGGLLIDEHGVATWAVNGSAIPKDCVEKAIYGHLPVNEERTRELRERQMDESIARYRESRKTHVYTAEELGEMRNSFGAGTVVVDVLTGRKIKL